MWTLNSRIQCNQLIQWLISSIFAHASVLSTQTAFSDPFVRLTLIVSISIVNLVEPCTDRDCVVWERCTRKGTDYGWVIHWRYWYSKNRILNIRFADQIIWMFTIWFEIEYSHTPSLLSGANVLFEQVKSLTRTCNGKESSWQIM